MSEMNFYPLTSQLGVSGTSYRVQLGLINDKWASRLLRGKDVLDSYVYKEEEMGAQGGPNQNYIVGWVLRTVAIPNINPHQIMKTVQVLVKQAIEKKNRPKDLMPVSETKGVQLQKVPAREIKRTRVQGYVKREEVKSQQQLEEDVRQAFKQKVMAKGQGSTPSTSTVKTTRQLPTIPSGASKVEPTNNIKDSLFCGHCGKDLQFKFCPFCGKPLPH